MLAGFLVMPFLVHALGLSTYGLWILIGSLTGYFGLLDLGVATAVGRLVAGHRAKGDIGAINAVVSTATALLLGVLVLCGVVTIAAIWIFPMVFLVPQELAGDVTLAISIVGAHLAIAYPGYVFTAIIWGYARFDLQSMVDLPATVLRTIATFVFVGAHWQLTTLALITFFISIASILLRMLICRRLEPRLAFRRSLVDRDQVHEIYSFGVWMSLLGISRTLIPQIPLAIIGNRLSAAAVTSFVVARQLVAYANSFSITATQVLAPKAAADHATGRTDAQASLFLLGGKYATSLALLFAGGAICFGQAFLTLWQPLIPATAYSLMVILMLGEVLPMSQWLTYSIIVGSQRHRMLAYLAIGEAIVVSLSSWLLLDVWGLAGVSLGIALTGFATRGVVPWLICGRVLQVSKRRYFSDVFMRVSLAAAIPVGIFFLVSQLWSLKSWLVLVANGVAFGLLFAIFAFVFILPSDLRRLLVDAIRMFYRRRFVG